jgi:hypothetical protein
VFEVRVGDLKWSFHVGKYHDFFVSWFRAPGNADKMKKDEQGTLSLQ